jgi:hypothetical protein
MPIPRTDNELMVWLNNFSTAFATHAAALGFTEAEVASVAADAAMLNFLVGDLVPTYKAAFQARTSYKTLMINGPVGTPDGGMPPAPSTAAAPASVAPGILPRTRLLLQRIQAAPGYTEAIGDNLGIVGPPAPTPIPAALAKPTAKATAIPGSEVQVGFSKGDFDGVLVEGRRTGETAWTTLGTDYFSPFADTRPPLEAGRPETREYRLRYLLRDEPVGEWSDIVAVVTKP